MDALLYLRSYGWNQGEALRPGGLRKPILVKHKKDSKGIGADSNDTAVWWEKLFDGHLKTLEVTSSAEGVTFSSNEEAALHSVTKADSPLYRMFVKGKGLAGSVGKTDFLKKSTAKIDNAQVIQEIDLVMRKSGESTLRKMKNTSGKEGRLKNRINEETKELRLENKKERKKAKKEKRERKENNDKNNREAEQAKKEKKEKKQKKQKKEKRKKKENEAKDDKDATHTKKGDKKQKSEEDIYKGTSAVTHKGSSAKTANMDSSRQQRKSSNGNKLKRVLSGSLESSTKKRKSK